MLDVRTDGAAELAALARALKETGQKQLRRDLYRAVGKATAPTKAAVQESARAKLPSGLGEWVASKLSMRRKLRTGAKTAGVSLIFSRPNARNQGGKADIGRINRGRTRHPTYGHRPWVLQDVPSGFINDVADGFVQRSVAREVLRVLADIKARIVRAA